VYCRTRAKLEKWLFSAIRLLSAGLRRVHLPESLVIFPKGWDCRFRASPLAKLRPSR